MTFDQPLYAKAMEIILTANDENPVASVIVRLGGFYLLMSFIGTIMSGSRIESLWEIIYYSNTVAHMSGHAYARGLRAHFLIQIAIAVICLEKMNLTEETIREVTESYDALLCDERRLQLLQNSNT